jgi:hypothetical protein
MQGNDLHDRHPKTIRVVPLLSMYARQICDHTHLKLFSSKILVTTAYYDRLVSPLAKPP